MVESLTEIFKATGVSFDGALAPDVENTIDPINTNIVLDIPPVQEGGFKEHSEKIKQETQKFEDKVANLGRNVEGLPNAGLLDTAMSAALKQVRIRKEEDKKNFQKVVDRITSARQMEQLLERMREIKDLMSELKEQMEALQERINQAQEALDSDDPEQVENALQELYDIDTEGMSNEEMLILLQQQIETDQQTLGTAQNAYDELYEEYLELAEQAQNADPDLLAQYADELEAIEAQIDVLNGSETGKSTRNKVDAELTDRGHDSLHVIEHLTAREYNNEVLQSFANLQENLEDDITNNPIVKAAGHISNPFNEAASGEEKPDNTIDNEADNTPEYNEGMSISDPFSMAP